jgi:hypothetical protein
VRKGLLVSVAALLGGAGLALGQAPATPTPPLTPAPAPQSVNPALAVTPGCADDSAGRFWGGADYLLWWTKASPAPPLIITGPSPALTTSGLTTSPAPPEGDFIGFLSSTEALAPLTLGSGGVPLNHDTQDGVRSGFRLVLGGWVDSERTFGVEGSYFFLASRSSTFEAGSKGTPALAIPYIDATTGKEAGFAIAQPATPITNSLFVNITPAVLVHLQDVTTTDAFSGRAAITTSSRLQGAEANAVWGPGGLGSHVQVLAGFRWAQLDEGLNFVSAISHDHSETTVTEPALLFPGAAPFTDTTSSLTTRWDQFDTHNNFYGAQLGLRGEYEWNRFSVMAGAKAALGTMNQSVTILGASQFSTTSSVTPTQAFVLTPGLSLPFPTGAPVTTTTSGRSPGGFFAQPSNIGHYSRNVFAVVPEVNLKVGYQVTSHLRATVGYSFLYMSSVVRPGDQIDRTINPSLLASPPVNGTPVRPLFQFNSTDYWAQGVDFGLEFRF